MLLSEGCHQSNFLPRMRSLNALHSEMRSTNDDTWRKQWIYVNNIDAFVGSLIKICQSYQKLPGDYEAEVFSMKFSFIFTSRATLIFSKEKRADYLC